MMINCNDLLEQAESLKKELNDGRNGLNNDGSGKGKWVSSRTSLQDVYRQLLITNLEYALDKKIEQDLWNFVFKNHITALQQKVKDKSNTFRAEVQSQLTSFLDAASGFYTQLLDDLCQTFNINIPYRVHSSKLVFLRDGKSVKHKSVAQPERPSCQYLCQHCLVHLGDIARYRNQIGQAESYYRYAAQLVPSNGQPYNQLAILAAAAGDVLSTAFFYCRSLAVKCPFPGSDTNLRRQLTKIMAGDEPRHTKISTSELVKFCLKFHACIYLKKNETELHGMVEKLSGYIRAHLRAGSLSRQQMTHMTFLNLFSLYHLAPNGINDAGDPTCSGGKTEVSEEKQITNKEESKPEVSNQNLSWSVLLTFTMHMLSGLLACVPAHSDDASDLEHPALPSIKLTLDWLASNTATLQRAEVTQNSRVWPRLAKVLNALGNQDKANNMDNHHLPEDLEVRGFLGLKTTLSKLDFLSGIESGVPANMEHSCRCYRLYQLGMTISRLNGDLLSYVEENTGTVFSSSISPSPQHGAKMNGVEECSEEEEEEESEEEPEKAPTPPKSGVLVKSRELALLDGQSVNNGGRRSQLRTKGVLKVVSDEHSPNLRKKNRAPRMQNVAVQIKPDKQKVSKEEESGHMDSFIPVAEAESGGTSNDSSQGDTSPSIVPHSRSGHRVTFATAQPISPMQYPHEDTPSPSPVGTGYMDSGGMMIPGVPMYPDSTPHPIQQPYNMHLVSQHIAPTYRHPVAGSPILTGPFARRNVAPYPFPQNMMARSHIQLPPFHHMHPTNPPPHPTELPKPVFQGSLHNPAESGENFRPPSGTAQIGLSSHLHDANMERMMKMSRPADAGYFQQMQQNPLHNLGNISSAVCHDLAATQRPVGPNLTMAAQFSNRPNVNASLMQQLRMKEIAHNAEMSSNAQSDAHHGLTSASNLPYHTPNLFYQKQPQPGMEFSQFANTQLPPSQQPGIMMRNQMGGISNPGSIIPPRQMQAMESEIQRFPLELNRGYFPGNLIASSNSVNPGGSSNTSSTSSPTPASLSQLGNLPNTTTSPQTGSMGQIKHNAGVGNVLGQGFPTMLMEQPLKSGDLEAPRRPTTLSSQQLQHGAANFGGSPSQKLTPTRLAQLLNSEHSQSDRDYNMDLATASIFGMPQTSSSILTDDMRPLSNPLMHSTSAETYTIHQDKVKAIFEEGTNLAQLPNSSLDSNQQSVQQHLDKFHNPLVSEQDKASYKLFPVTDSTWGNSLGNRDGFGLSGLGSIGSERAAAQQNHRYSPWSGANQATTTPPSNLSEKLELQNTSEVNRSAAEGNFSGLQSQSFWSTPMVPSGPSALEQLIRQQQQQHVTRDKSPP